MNLFEKTKTIPISKEQVWSAWKKVKSNGDYLRMSKYLELIKLLSKK